MRPLTLILGAAAAIGIATAVSAKPVTDRIQLAQDCRFCRASYPSIAPVRFTQWHVARVGSSVVRGQKCRRSLTYVD